MKRLVALCGLLAWIGCDAPTGVDAGRSDAGVADGGGPDAASTPLRDPWADRATPDVAGVDLFAARPWLAEASPWSSDFDPASGTPSRTRRGGQPVGNGECFAFVGLGEPDLLTMRELVGPGYDASGGYFGDLTLEVLVDDVPWTATSQTQWRVRGTDIVVTLARGEGLVLTVVDFAPWTRPAWVGVAAPEERAVVRWIVSQPTDAARVRLRVRGVGWSVDAGRLAQRRAERTATVSPLGTAGEEDDVDAIGLEPNDVFVAMVTSRSDADRDATLSALSAPADVLIATRDAWRGWVADGAQLETDPPRVGALIDAARIHVRAQQSSTGATSPMSLYTRTWLRDTIGPVQLLAALGHHDAAAEMLDAQYDEILRRGDLTNSMDAARRDPPPPVPDFASLGPLPDRVRAESPSHVVLGYDALAEWSGDRTRMDERWALLRRALLDQHVDADGLLPFSGDETYRTAMAFAHDLPLIEEFVDGFRSLDSSALFVDAARRLARHADALGHAMDADTLRAMATRVEAAAHARYGPDGGRGFWAPYLIERDGVVEATDRAFEDSTLQATLRGLDPGPESVLALWDQLGTDRGFPHSPRAERYAVLLRSQGAELGIHTGMSPGYFLGAASRVELRLDEGAFDAVGRTASPAGEWPEYAVFDDHSNLTLGYDPTGMRGDDTARVRPWEGGLNARALLDHLFGIAPELGATGRVRIAPHLPPSMRSAELRGVRIGDARADLLVEGLDGEVEHVRLTLVEGTLPEVVFVIASGAPRELTVDGDPAAPESTEPRGDRVRQTLPPRSMNAGDSVDVRLGD